MSFLHYIAFREVFFTNFNFEEIGKRIRHVRGTLSQTTFGDSIDSSRSYVNNIEHGAKPSIEFLANVCLVYNVSLDWLVFGKEVQLQTLTEATPDQDLKEMTDVLKHLLESNNPDMRGWAKVQFNKIFKDYC